MKIKPSSIQALGEVGDENSITREKHYPATTGQLIITSASILLSIFTPCLATTYYVDGINGHDNNDGLSLDTAFQSIFKATRTIITSDDIYIRGGTYNEGVYLDTGGTQDDYTLIKAYESETVVINPGELFSGWNRDPNGIYHLTIIGFGEKLSKSGLIRRNGFGITRVESFEDLLNPNITEAIDANDYDFYWSDPHNPDEVYLKISGNNDVDPNTHIYVIRDAGQQFFITPNAPYVEIDGISIRYGSFGIHPYSDNIRIINCSIQHTFKSAIASACDNLYFEDNYFAYVGTPFKYNNERYQYNNLRHALYLKGNNITIHSNEMKACSGGPIISMGNGSVRSKNWIIKNNLIYGQLEGEIEDSIIANNLILLPPEHAFGRGSGMKLTHFKNLQISNNLIWGGAQAGVIIGKATIPDETSTLSFKNNIVICNPLSSFCIWLGKFDLNNSEFNHNYYYGRSEFRLDFMMPEQHIFKDFSEYQIHMYNQSDYGHETHSFFGDPMLIEPDVADYHLSPDSPCINAGIPDVSVDPNSYNPYSPHELDLDGFIRVAEDFVDIGPYEYSNRALNPTIETWYPAIQAAIDAAADGEEIIVYPGTYYEQISFLGKAITLRSVDPNDWAIVESTVIDTNDITAGVGVTFDSAEGSDSILSGITVKNGLYGINVSGSTTSPVIEKSIIEGNLISGIYCYASSPTITHNIVRDNAGMDAVAGIYYTHSSDPWIANNWIYGNFRGILPHKSDGTICSNTITDNTHCGIWARRLSSPVITNCILWNNSDDLKGCDATYSCFKDGNSGTGNVSADPYFVDAANHDYHLSSGSPCIDAGDPVGMFCQSDIDGDERVQNGSSDMGADETPCILTPPPDPMTWSIEPYATSPYSISMAATTAANQIPVEYYFECTAGGGHDSGWQDGSTYEDTGLNPDTEYSYQVKARDKNDVTKETAYSEVRSAMTTGNNLTPDPMTWSIEPYATGPYSISMSATTAANQIPVEYYFECTAGGGHDSGWQDGSTYKDTGLTPDTEYSYQVKVRDKNDVTKETAYSEVRSATTPGFLIDTQSFEGEWPPLGWSYTGRWDQQSDQVYSGTYSAGFDGHNARGGASGDLVSIAKDTNNAVKIQIAFWRYSSLSNGGFYVDYYDNTGTWNEIASLSSSRATWTEFADSITDSVYFHTNFKIRFRAAGLKNKDSARIDLVTVVVMQ